MAFEMLKTDYKDDILNTSVNQLRRYTIVNNADGTISLIDSTAYSTVGTFIGAKDINTICANMNTIMGYIETEDGDLAQEFQDYFAEQKGIFEDNVEAYMQDFQNASQTQFTVWYDANTAAWSQEVENRINAIIASLTELVEDNGPFVLNKAYRVGNLLTWNIGDGITRGYLVINPVPANMGIYPSNKTYFMEVTREGAQGVGLGMTPRGNWRSIITYVENDWVVHNWVYWLCLNENTDSEPSESNANWEKIYDITADMPIQFDEPEENSLSFMEILSNIISGQTLGNLFKHIKGSFIKLLKKFGDTEYTTTGTSVTYDSSNNSKAVITKITGATTVSRPNTSADVSPDNVQTFKDASNFVVISESDNNLAQNYQLTLSLLPILINIKDKDGANLILGSGSYVFKIIHLGGNYTGNITFNLLDFDTSLGTVNANTLNEIEFSLSQTSRAMRLNISGTANDYKFMAVIYKKDAQYKANSFSYTGKLGALTEDSDIVNTIEYDENTGVTELVERWKSVTFNGSENWIIHPNQPSDTTLTRFHLFYSTSKINGDISSNLFVKGDYTATKELIYIHNTTAYVNVIIKKSRITGWSDSLTDAQKNNLYKSFLSTTNLIVRYELATPIRTTLTTKPALTTYEGTTNIFTTASPQVSMDVDFKSRFWALDYGKIDKANISKNFTTTDWEQVASAPLVKELKEDVGALNDSLNKIGIVYYKQFSNLSITTPTTWTRLTDIVTIDEDGIYLITINSIWTVPTTTTRLSIRGFINNAQQPNLSCEAPIQQQFVSTSISAPITLYAGNILDVRGYAAPTIPAENYNSISLVIIRIK